jgi:RNA polymerase sigma factor (sigma-70 family)
MSDDAATLVAAAAAGDPAAWETLVERYSGLMWAVARSFRLDSADAGDAVQTAWLRLLEHLDRIEDPERLPAWLATTTRRECLRLLRRGQREAPADDDTLGEVPDTAAPLDAGLLLAERDAALWRAFEQISDRCQGLLRVLMASPPPSYSAVSAALDMPIGSIGPTRQRCLDQLRRVVAADSALADPGAPAGGTA